jgi:hypothetical protein
MTTVDNAIEILAEWEAEQRLVYVLYARAGGEVAVRLRGTLELKSAGRLNIQARDASLILPLSGANLKYGPLQYVPPPFNKLESIDGLYIWLKANDWAFLTVAGEIPAEVQRLSAVTMPEGAD